ncbi:MAG: aspartate ammonia-lyase, partial [Verrucomicrobia bacterium 21-51-4]
VEIKNELIPSLELLEKELSAKAGEWADIVKIGRTHLMDATPLTLGQEFSGYAAQVKKGVQRAKKAIDALRELAIGGTAVGTGINCHRDFPRMVCDLLREKTQIDFCEAANHFEAQGGRDDCVEVAGYLATIATSLSKIANDVRLMASGPRSGFFEITLPATQPGSSIMPGKVNPVMCEMLAQVCIYTIGLCNMVVMCGRDGHFELNVNVPMMSYALHESVHCLSRACRVFAESCIRGAIPNRERCQELVERSLMLVTALNPYIGYDKAAYVAKRAFQEGRTLKDVVLEEGLMDLKTLEEALDPKSMTHPEGA